VEYGTVLLQQEKEGIFFKSSLPFCALDEGRFKLEKSQPISVGPASRRW
jgi:hypothetical protein